ncbi:hypothetical protein [Mycobacterium riyadhense]|nr:hypothetical protein [Mycobacterium riyadhense]
MTFKRHNTEFFDESGTELGSRRCQTGSGGILFRQMRTRAAPGPA